jgi:hypothetical protein
MASPRIAVADEIRKHGPTIAAAEKETLAEAHLAKADHPA